MKQFKAFCKVKNVGAPDAEAWTEDFKVTSKKSAEEESRAVIDNFNNTLKPYETEREFVSLLRVEETEIPEPDEDDDDDYRDDYRNDYFYDDDDDEY